MRRLLLCISLVVCFSCLYAQKAPDTELWTGGIFKLRINKAFRAELREQIRFNDNVSSFKSTFTQLGLRYRLNKSFAFKVNFRYIIRPKRDRLRFSADAYYNWSKKKFPLSAQYRLRFQNTLRPQSGNSTTYLRNKVSVDYNLSKLIDPFLSYELYFRFNGKNEFRVYRLTLGGKWRLNKRIDVSSFYRFQSDIFVKKPDREHIFGLIFSYRTSVKRLKKKIKEKTSGGD